MASYTSLCIFLIISIIVLSCSDAALIPNALGVMNRRYYAIYRRPSRSGRRTEPPKNKKKRKFYEDNKYKKGPGYYEDKKPGPARKKHIDLDDYLEE